MLASFLLETHQHRIKKISKQHLVEITEGTTAETQSDTVGLDTATSAGNNENGGEESFGNNNDDVGDDGSGNDDEPASNTDSPDEDEEGEQARYAQSGQ